MPPRFSPKDDQFKAMIAAHQEGAVFDLWFCQPNVMSEAGAVVGMVVHPSKISIRREGDYAKIVNGESVAVNNYYAFAFTTAQECMAYAKEQLINQLPKHQKDLKLKLGRFQRAELLVKNAVDPYARIARRANLLKFKSRYEISSGNLEAVQEMIGLCS